MSTGGRFGRGKSRLIQREQVIYDKKIINKRIGKIAPEDTIKVPIIGEWSVGDAAYSEMRESKRAMSTMKVVRPFPKSLPLTDDQVQRILETPGPVEDVILEEPKIPAKNIIQAPLKLQQPKVMHPPHAKPEPRLEFPEGTVTTDLSSILRSKKRSLAKPLPPLNSGETDGSEFLPLEYFDDIAMAEYSLEELMEHPTGASRYIVNGVVSWEKCHILDYDSETRLFTIKWDSNGKTKRVPRFNVIFEKEDPRKFERRIIAAEKARVLYQASLRLDARIALMPTDNIPGISDEVYQRIYHQTGETEGRYRDLQGEMEQEIKAVYKTMQNEMEFQYELEHNPLIPNRDEFLMLKKGGKTTPEYGLVAPVRYNFAELRNEIHSKHLFANSFIQEGLYKIWAIFQRSYHITFLKDGFKGILTLEDFVTKQYQHFEDSTNEFKSAIQTTLENVIKEVTKNRPVGSQASHGQTQLKKMVILTARMLHTVLRVIVNNTINDYMELFKKYLRPDCNDPPEFYIDVYFHEDRHLDFMPPIDIFQDQLLSLLQQLETTVGELPIMRSDKLNFDTSSVTFDDCIAVVRESREECQKVLVQLFEQLYKFRDENSYIASALEMDPYSYVNEFDPDGTRTLGEYRERLTELEKIRDRIVTDLKYTYNLGLFRVSCKSFKDAAVHHMNELMANLLNQVKRHMMENISELKTEYDNIRARLKQVPTTPEELAGLRSYMEEINSICESRDVLMKRANDRFAFLEDFNYSLDDDEFEYRYRVLQMPRKTVQLMDDADKIIAQERVKMIRDLRANQRQLENDTLATSEELTQFTIKYNDLDLTQEACTIVNKIQDKLQELKTRQDLYNSHEKLFEFEPVSCRILIKLSEEFAPLHLLWNLANEWCEVHSGWLEKPFPQIKTEAMNQFLAVSHKKCQKVKKDLYNQRALVERVVVPLTAQIDNFKQSMPLLMKLRHPGIKKKHWELISEVAGFDVAPSMETTLDEFLRLDLGRWIDKISDIAGVAAQEYQIESALDQMDVELQGTKFVTVQYKNSGQFILQQVDDVLGILDDQTVTTQTLLTSPFVAPVRERATDRLQFLRTTHETLDMWIVCQRNWLYLHPIFSGTTIQQKLLKEASDWIQANKLWSQVMTLTHNHPDFMNVMHRDGLADQLRNCNLFLEGIVKGLNAYLESKRLNFPRFFFLSNDELIAILSHTKDIDKIQDSISKLFEYVNRISVEYRQITHMNDINGEAVKLFGTVDMDTLEIEDWLIAFEDEMRATLKEYIRNALQSYNNKRRDVWIQEFPAQAVLIANQIMWTQLITNNFKNMKLRGLKAIEKKYADQLEFLCGVVRKPINTLTRKAISCLLIFEVHNRDIIRSMIDDEVSDVQSFHWTKQLRYYWDDDTVMVHSINNAYEYSYEYAGNSSRLVLTPLTDRCYQTLLAAFKQNLSGAPSGPAGTGKTETVRDCAKALGRACVVYNCSENVTPEQMSQFFAGLSTSGSWSCFDEFNRINIEVLSVIAQQVRTIQSAMNAHAEVFVMDQRTLKLNPNAAICITMNPGYHGRVELPDNLKALFRPCAMMVPDYKFICEILLFSGGFVQASQLSVKLVALFELCKTQLSNCYHYDWGMRAMKTILENAGNEKQLYPDEEEAVLLIHAVRNCTATRLLAVDLPFFEAIIQDVFPGLKAERAKDEHLVENLKRALKEMNKQPLETIIGKAIEVYMTQNMRHGLMLVGAAMSGKSTAWRALEKALNYDNESGVVRIKTLNPKSITLDELYGCFNPATSEWTDGILSSCIRECSFAEDDLLKWIIVDGPVDSEWIESMNSLLDDNKVLCLPNNERIQLTSKVRMMFEVGDLKNASPATVSRCGMVYFDTALVPWKALVDSWYEKISGKHPAVRDIIMELVDQYIPSMVKFLENDAQMIIPVTANFAVQSLLTLLEAYLPVLRKVEVVKVDGTDETKSVDPLCQSDYFSQFSGSDQNQVPVLEEEQYSVVFERVFIFCLVWSFGGLLEEDCRIVFDRFMKDLIEVTQARCPFPPRLTVFDYYADLSRFSWIAWCDGATGMSFTLQNEIDRQLIPTNEAAAPLFFSRLLAHNEANFLLFGPETCKSLSGYVLSHNMLDPAKFSCHHIPLASCSQPKDVTRFMLSKMHRRHGKFGPLLGQHLLFFIDNMNSVKPEKFGGQPTLELLRQMCDYSGWYNTKTIDFVEIMGTSIMAAMGQPGGGVYPVSDRLLRHFFICYMPKYSITTMHTIMYQLMIQRMTRHSQPVRDAIKTVCNATCEMLEQINMTLLPVPSKLHYVFGIRNIVRVIKGIMLVTPQFVQDDKVFSRLWYHEMMREFYDRFNTQIDRSWFVDNMRQLFQKHFKAKWEVVNPGGFLMFNQFVDGSQRYKEVTTKPDQVLDGCVALLEEHNRDATKSINITLFHEAVEHLSCIARALAMERGHMLLVGVKSSGRKSLARLALHMTSYEVYEISVSSTYNLEEWHDNVKTLLKMCGIQDQVVGFIIHDGQIVLKEQLEDLANLISEGMIPQLYENDEIEQIRAEIAASEISADVNTWKLFLDRIRRNLHILLVVSPYGNVFRDICIHFTTLRGECVIDWFMPWSQNALESVAQDSLSRGSVGSPDVVNSVVSVCVKIQKNVEEQAVKYLNETKRFTAVTPSRYFELLATFHEKLVKKQCETAERIRDYETGVDKIKATKAQIEEMSQQLDRDIPVLEQTHADVENMLKELTVKQAEVEETKGKVEEQQQLAEKEAAAAAEANAIAQEQLAIAQPLLIESQEAVQKLDKDSLVNIKKLHAPTAGMKETFEAVCIMFGRQPRKVDGAVIGTKEDDYWPETVSLLNDVQFIKNVTNFKVENISKESINKLKKYVPTNKATRTEKRKAALASFLAVGALYDWVCASFDYWFVYQEILPKKKAAEEAAKKLEASQAALQAAKAHLKAVEDRLKNLQKNVEEMQQREKDLTESVHTTEVRLARAQKIMVGLAGEGTRWEECADTLRNSSIYILGDSLLIAGVLTYLGAFSPTYREHMVDEWMSFLQERGIKYSADFSIESALGNDITIRDWIIKGLPNDKHSIENALIITQNENSVPLLIDPQLSGTRWLREIYGSKLMVLRFDQDDFILRMKIALSQGSPVLIDNVGLKLDPVIDPILSKDIINTDGKPMISLGGDTVGYNENFRLYISTKYPNPHYSPEVCSQTTLINFTTTQEGLTDLLLNNLIEVEREELDRKRLQMMESNAENFKKLKEIEVEILKIVSNAGSDILDDDNAIDTLTNAQKTSAMIEQQMAVSEKTEQQIIQFKNRFKAVVDRAALLYFCASDFGVIDPMYQFSLKWFVPLFRNAIINAEHPPDHMQTIAAFHKAVALQFFKSVSYSLFSQHKLLFSALMAFRILLADRKISSAELAFLVSPATVQTEPEVPHVTAEQWSLLGALPKVHHIYEQLFEHMKMNKLKWKEWLDSETPELLELPSHGSVYLSSFQKLLLIRALHLHRLREGIMVFIEETLGKEFTVPPTLNLLEVFKNSDPLSPLIFIINPGIDPEDEIRSVASTMGLDKYLKAYSLGRGQGEAAEELITTSADSGMWVLLQNCHLSLSWMPRLEQIINGLSPQGTHRRFRLCLVTMSSDQFPIGILYQGTKLIYETPKGMRENVLRIYNQFDPEEYKNIDPTTPERLITFKLAVLHSVILERLHYGSLGWNIPYEFNPSDFMIARRHMKAFLSELTTNDVPYVALSYVIGELDYGGRVTDSWDRRTLITLLKQFFTDDQRGFFSPRYSIPALDKILPVVIEKVSNWPLVTDGIDIGLSPNASTIISRKAVLQILANLIEVQPAIITATDNTSKDEFEINYITHILEQVPHQFNITDFQRHADMELTLNVVLLHEVQSYNKLLEVIKSSLDEMISGLRGLVIIDDRLENFKRKLLANKVPDLWLQNSFPSILSLRAYMKDLRQRIEFLDEWVRGGSPAVFKLGAFYHPEEFLTSVLQTYARKHNVPFDTLRWITTPIPEMSDRPLDKPPDEGVYIAGLVIEGAKWDIGRQYLVECGSRDLENRLPVMHLVPTPKKGVYDPKVTYECPVYRTQNRGTGALELPNYILSFFLPTPRTPPDTWIQRSVAAFITTE